MTVGVSFVQRPTSIPPVKYVVFGVSEDTFVVQRITLEGAEYICTTANKDKAVLIIDVLAEREARDGR